jgi:hypothetical protein
MSDTFSKVEVVTGVARRRRFPTEQKLAVVAETMQPGQPLELTHTLLEPANLRHVDQLCCPTPRAEPEPCGSRRR